MKAFIALIALGGVMLLGTGSFAATCPESVPAPRYQVGDRFTWKYTNGKEKVWEVTGMDGNLAEVKWSDGDSILASENAGIYFLDQDWVVRKAVTKRGDVLLSPKLGAFSMLGIKDLDFPLQVGKTWNFSFRSRNVSGDVDTFYTTLKVVGCEELTTLAGKFLTLKIEGQEVPQFYRSWGMIYRWYSPEAKNIVKVEFGGRGGGVPNYPGIRWSTRPVNYELTKLELR